MDNYSLSDIATATHGGDCWGGGMGGSWFAWILLFALFGFGGNGFGWGNRNGNPVTEADLCNSQNFNNLQNAVGRLSDNQAAIARQSDNAICQIGYQNLQNTNTLAAQIAECCCQSQLGTQSVKFDMANYAAATNANTTAVGQKILDKLCGMELAQKDAVIAQQNQRIGQLELNQALCGVIRYPTATTYGAGFNPFFGGFSGCNCGCNNI